MRRVGDGGPTAAGIGWPSPIRAWWAVAIFCGCAILSYTDRQILGLLVDPLRRDLAISDTQVSLLQGLAFAIIYSLAGLPIGRLADTVPRRLLIMAGVLCWSAATVACGLARDFGQLFIARFFVGIGEAALAPAAVSMIGDLFPERRRGSAIGLFSMGMIVGSGSALGVGGALLQAAQAGAFAWLPIIGGDAPWRIVLILLAIPGVVVVLLLATIVEPARRAQADAGHVRLTTGEVAAALYARRHVLAPLLAGMAFMSAGDFALLNWTPALLGRNFHEPPGFIGAHLGAIAVIAGACGALLGGWLSDALSAAGGRSLGARVAACGCVLAAPTVTIGMADGTLPVLCLFGLWIFTSTAVGTMGITLVQRSVPAETRGVMTAFNAFTTITIGLGLGTMVTAIITDHVFHSPLAVGKSLTLITAMGITVGSAMFLLASRRMSSRPVMDELPEDGAIAMPL